MGIVQLHLETVGRRDAADRGFYPVCVSDGCATHTEERHSNALRAFAGYCRTVTTDEALRLLL